ncbi:hypothetical protein AGLY_008094 [Aphis glycines]|uniref:C2H2-type domain-containing protein n=1 Tax=Aphis glycines TaxID=307491 RepID=A0A6G0TKV5_APHGL|nr:hypothetical protein AGLY_008094 [Aphis glycines]
MKNIRSIERKIMIIGLIIYNGVAHSHHHCTDYFPYTKISERSIVQIYCPKCNNIYENNKSLFTHLMYECASDERKFQCNICLVKFSQLHLLKCHMLSQHKATDCKVLFKNNNNKVLTSRFFNHEWPCPHNCGRSYKHKHTLSKHLKYECGVQPQFVCKNCARTFKRKHHLKKHTMSCDNVPPEFSCPFCNRLFREKWNLKLHLGCVHKASKKNKRISADGVKIKRS